MKSVLFSVLAVVVVAVVLFLLFRNKTREGNSGAAKINVVVGKSYKCQGNTHPKGEENSTSNSLYRGDVGNKLKRYGSWGAAVQYGGSDIKKKEWKTINCKNLKSGGVLKCNEDWKGTRNYRGCKNKTKEGKQCRYWDEGGGRMVAGRKTERHAGSRNYIAGYNDFRAKAYGLNAGFGRFRGRNNFCRTPSEKHGGQEKKPWCYTHAYKRGTNRKGWGYC
jgi:hypothetical protein